MITLEQRMFAYRYARFCVRQDLLLNRENGVCARLYKACKKFNIKRPVAFRVYFPEFENYSPFPAYPNDHWFPNNEKRLDALDDCISIVSKKLAIKNHSANLLEAVNTVVYYAKIMEAVMFPRRIPNYIKGGIDTAGPAMVGENEAEIITPKSFHYPQSGKSPTCGGVPLPMAELAAPEPSASALNSGKSPGAQVAHLELTHQFVKLQILLSSGDKNWDCIYTCVHTFLPKNSMP